MAFTYLQARLTGCKMLFIILWLPNALLSEPATIPRTLFACEAADCVSGCFKELRS